MRSRGQSFAKIGREIGLTGRDVVAWYNGMGKDLGEESIEDVPLAVAGDETFLDTSLDDGDDDALEDVGDAEVEALVKGLGKSEVQATAQYIDKRMSPDARAAALVRLARQRKSPSVALAALTLMTKLKAEDKGKPPPPAPLFALPPDAWPDMGGKVPGS